MRDIIAVPTPGLDLRQHYGHHQSPAIRAGGLIFCSGMVAIHPETGEREHGTVTSEARRIFENLKLLLESTGSSLDRLVQVHAMIYDRIEYDVLNRLYRQYVPNAPPARTVVAPWRPTACCMTGCSPAWAAGQAPNPCELANTSPLAILLRSKMAYPHGPNDRGC